ncbi:MAG: hypothetical protein IKC85_01235 [Bacteroidaceae bacterium]|nr:hypothetical protein [Bacteroidaceae bacterium]
MKTISFVSLFFIFKNACFFLYLWLCALQKQIDPLFLLYEKLGDIN